VPELRAFAKRPEETQDVAALVRGCVHGLRPGLAPTRFDSRVTTVLDAIRELDELRMLLDRAADMACLSPALPTCSETRSVFRSAGTCSGAN
jgi:hypothetical protein